MKEITKEKLNKYVNLTEKAIKNALKFARESGEVLSVNQAVRILSNGKS